MSDIHVDRKVLSDLQEIMEGNYLNLLETFLADSEDRLRQLYKARNAEELGHAAHSFKGSCSNMGAVGLAELCRQLEQRIQQHSLFDIEHLILQISREFSVVRQIYRAERERVLVG
ncbi:MAG: Hpt domain-containing protein [Paucimonas sp.]|nr:Hpt domain-containing protein [Paucimonas sp.]